MRDCHRCSTPFPDGETVLYVVNDVSTGKKCVTPVMRGDACPDCNISDGEWADTVYNGCRFNVEFIDGLSDDLFGYRGSQLCVATVVELADGFALVVVAYPSFVAAEGTGGMREELLAQKGRIDRGFTELEHGGRYRVVNSVLQLEAEMLLKSLQTVQRDSGARGFELLNAVRTCVDAVTVEPGIACGGDIGRRVADANGACRSNSHLTEHVFCQLGVRFAPRCIGIPNTDFDVLGEAAVFAHFPGGFAVLVGQDGLRNAFAGKGLNQVLCAGQDNEPLKHDLREARAEGAAGVFHLTRRNEEFHGRRHWAA